MDDTVLVDNDKTIVVSDDKTIVVGDNGVAQAVGVVLPINIPFVLNGKTCIIEKRIATSGEAEIYLMKMDKKTYIFKHYMPHRPLSDTAREVLSKIRNNPHDRIVKVIEFGKYNNQDYEIMEFAEGGTLSEYLEKNAVRDAKKLKIIVKMINEGLQQLHNGYNVIYQDLKPDNIFFKDAKHSQIILADFGISSVMEANEKKAQVKANLTDLYGALELSPKTGHKHVIATPAVDYYSLGITMIEMWLGEKPFKNIQAVERDYLISEERVDFPPDMPEDYKTLIQGLIKPSRSERWGDKQIQQWLKGQPLQASGKAAQGFATEMFSDTESYSSPKELADLMAKYPEQGEKLLYSGVAESWFRKSARELRAEEIKEIATTYANDKKSGYYASIYKIDPSRAWMSKSGKACANLEEIAAALLAESAYYMEDLKKPNAQLYLYIAAVEGATGAAVSEMFRKYFTEYSPKRALALICLNLQNRYIAIGSKKYGSPEELSQEKDVSQINFIKKEVMETDSMLLVWLSSFYNDKLPSANAFGQQPTSGKFFLLGLLPCLSFKEIDSSWQTNAKAILLEFINNNSGRADLFEAYAAQGLPLNDGLDYAISNFNNIINKHGKDTILNLICLLVKLGADSGVALYFAMSEWHKYNGCNGSERYKQLENMLLGQGAKLEAALCIAAKHDNGDIVDLLLKHGANKNVKDKFGKTPYDYAEDIELKNELKPYSFNLFESLVKLRREGNKTFLKFLGIVSAIISGVGVLLGCFAIGIDGEWTPMLIAGLIGGTAYSAFEFKMFPPITIVLPPILGIIGFVLFAINPQPAKNYFYGTSAAIESPSPPNASGWTPIKSGNITGWVLSNSIEVKK